MLYLRARKRIVIKEYITTYSLSVLDAWLSQPIRYAIDVSRLAPD